MKAKKSETLGLAVAYQENQETAQLAALPLELWLMRQLLRLLGSPRFGVTFWDGQHLDPPGSDATIPRLLLNQRRSLWRLFSNTTLHFGDDYSAGDIEIEGGLVAFLEEFYRAGERIPTGVQQLLDVFGQLRHWRGNPLDRARDNIYHHYDIGNEFYRLWLDDEMVYTCAYFAPGAETLEQAQFAKMEHVCRKLQLKPGQNVVEAGCGWGALARHMARHHGVKVRAFNISHEQVAYARARAKAEGLDGQIEYIEDDYRNITGEYDAFASVGMLEHVGVKHYAELGAVIDRCLKPHGRGLIHSIGQNKPCPTSEWTQKRIFPGGYAPALREMLEIFECRNLTVLDVENLRLHYARTLEHWLERFERQHDRVRLMYDEAFIRTWRLYLSGSIANFSTGNLQLFQVQFARHDDNSVPWSRHDLYPTEE